MLRFLGVLCVLSLLVIPAIAVAGDLKGDYLETRTCDVYTGPCFGNGQGGLGGRDAILAWSIDRGSYDGVELAGLKVVLVLNASDTLGFGGTLKFNPDVIKSLVIVDERATPRQQEALRAFAVEHGQHAGDVVAVVAAPIDMKLDHFELVGKLKAGKYATIETRKISPSECVCSNETNFYPPLCDVKNANAALTVDGGFSGDILKTQWSNPLSRSAFVATFSY